MNLKQLLQAQEGKTLEFKRDLSSSTNIMKTLTAFANTAGGIMLIGVEDDHTVLGISGDPLDEEERLCNMIADSIAPRLIPNIELIPYDELTLLAIEVFPSQLRPHYLKQRGEQQGVFVRLGSTNRQADLPLVEELKRTVTGKGFDELPLQEAEAGDIDFSALTEAFKTIRPLAKDDMPKMRLLTRIQDRLVPTVGGMLLFGKRRDHFFPDAWIQCGRFIGTEKIHIFDHIDINVPLPKAVAEIMLFHLYYPLYSIILITIKYFGGSFRNKLFILIGRLKATNSNYAQRNILFHWRMGQSGPNAPECVSHPLYRGNTEEHRLKREIKKTNPRLIRLITDLKTLSREKDVHIWRDIAKRLELNIAN